MIKTMFYKTTPLIFEHAKQLRNNLTDAEIKLWAYLRTKPLGYKFRRQHPIGIFIADFYCHALLLVIEVDGNIHLQSTVKLHDEERQQSLESDGLTVIRFTNNEVLKYPETVIEKIQTLLQEKYNSANSASFKFPLQGAEGVS